MAIQQKIAVRIKAIRQEKGLTQEALAWSADVDRTFMNHVESGRKNISLNSLEKILSGLGISFKDFFNHKDFTKS
ncbi:MAG: helix-turn-helix domain-containing protein [Cyclobacteriaceae bacterium]